MRFVLACLLLAGSSTAAPSAAIHGSLKLWHPVTLSVVGPEVAEDSTPNPFLDYRLTVTFTHAQSGTKHVVPGFFAADGKAAETSATKGNQWQARFTPDRSGTWKYEASLRSGPAIALSTDPADGQPTPFDGARGEFRIAQADPKAPGFLRQGTLRYTGEHYLQFAGTGDALSERRRRQPRELPRLLRFRRHLRHRRHLQRRQERTGQGLRPPTTNRTSQDWQRRRPHLAGRQRQGHHRRPQLPRLQRHEQRLLPDLQRRRRRRQRRLALDLARRRDRFDCSKLDQWEIVFSHMDRLGLMLHVITQETENDRKLGGGPNSNRSGKLYLPRADRPLLPPPGRSSGTSARRTTFPTPTAKPSPPTSALSTPTTPHHRPHPRQQSGIVLQRNPEQAPHGTPQGSGRPRPPGGRARATDVNGRTPLDT